MENLDIHLTQLICPNYRHSKILPLAIRKIKNIQYKLFYLYNFSNVKEIYLGGNMITKLYNDIFYGLVNLQHLFLEYNDIELIEENAFNGLDKLVQLNLCGNFITHIYPKTFINLTNLECLLLGNNYLVHMNDVFIELPKLKTIDLCNNCIIKRLITNSVNINYDCNFLKKNIISDKLYEYIKIDNIYEAIKNRKYLRYLFDIKLNENNFYKLFDTKCDKILLIIKKIQHLINLSIYDIDFENLWNLTNRQINEKINKIIILKSTLCKMSKLNGDFINIVFDYI
jgi:hypothetical protein